MAFTDDSTTPAQTPAPAGTDDTDAKSDDKGVIVVPTPDGGTATANPAGGGWV